ITVNIMWIFILFPINTNKSNRQIHFTIKSKINYTIWIIVFITFAIIGTFTYFIFRDKNKSIQYYNLIEQINIAVHILNNYQLQFNDNNDLAVILNNLQ